MLKAYFINSTNKFKLLLNFILIFQPQHDHNPLLIFCLIYILRLRTIVGYHKISFIWLQAFKLDFEVTIFGQFCFRFFYSTRSLFIKPLINALVSKVVVSVVSGKPPLIVISPWRCSVISQELIFFCNDFNCIAQAQLWLTLHLATSGSHRSSVKLDLWIIANIEIGCN